MTNGISLLGKCYVTYRSHNVSYVILCYVICDRYQASSVKNMTRSKRQKGASRVFKLTEASKLPDQAVVLGVHSNKALLIKLIIDDLQAHPVEHHSHKLIVTGPEPVPSQTWKGEVTIRMDLANHQEEADSIIVCQIKSAQASKAVIIADDTDILLLLMHFVHSGDISGKVRYVIS